MKASLRYRLFFIALLLLLGLGLLNPSLLNTYLIDPLTRITWLVIRTFLMFDQNVYWVLLIFAVFTFVLRILPSRPETPLRPAYTETTRQEDRVAYWEALLSSAEDSSDARSALEQELANLSQSVQSLAEGDNAPAIELPPVPNGAKQQLKMVRKASHFLRALINPDWKRNTDLEKRVSSILKSLESQLEIDHD